MFEGFFCGSDANACVVDFIQFCLLPRVLTSPMDALFCAEFVRALVRWEVKNYNHILFVKRVCPSRRTRRWVWGRGMNGSCTSIG